MKVLLIISTLFFGLIGAIKSNAQSVPEIDFCDLFESYEKYEGRLISSTALITGLTVPFEDSEEDRMYSLKCNDPDHVSHITFATKQPFKFLKYRKTEERYIFAIKFVGRIVVAETLDFGHLGWARADIQIAKITQSLGLPTESKLYWPNRDAASPLKDKAKQLRAFPSQFFPSLYIPPQRLRDSVGSLLTDDFILTKKDGKTLTKDEYLKLDPPIIASYKGGGTIVGMKEIIRNKNGVSAVGSITTDDQTPDEQTFTFLLSLTYKDGSWLLNAVKLK